MKLNPVVLALLSVVPATPLLNSQDSGVASGTDSLARGLPRDPDGYFSLQGDRISSYDGDGNLLASRPATSADAAVLQAANEAAGDVVLKGGSELEHGELGILWPWSCSPPIACSKSSTCTGRCSSCVKVGFFPIRFCAQ